MNLAVNLADGNILLYGYDFKNILLSFRQRGGCGVCVLEGVGVGGAGGLIPAVFLSSFKRKIGFVGLLFL